MAHAPRAQGDLTSLSRRVGTPLLCASYHTSPRNTLTGKLIREAFDQLLEQVRKRLGSPRNAPWGVGENTLY